MLYSIRCPAMDWQSVQGVSCLPPNDSWNRLQHPPRPRGEKDNDPLLKKMNSLSLVVAIVLSSLLVKHGASDDGPLIQQTSDTSQPTLKKHYTLNETSHEDTMNATVAPIQNATKAPEGLYNSTNAVESSESGISGSGSWVWVVCVIVVILLLIPVILLLVPSFRQRMKFFPASASTGMSALQEMPQTKQDATEIQWDLAWMEMANLLDKQHYPGS
ncbi:uncharacterized protein LOC118808163 isoform X2 [Colossoma macropomum]|uniref:uncharacterized protein LOC118808163 isoform X2 n=1 Tax=Colossoma macropomum TaxID=42526 RepID=UPI00186422E3|nr:uncharacterized protein LOC118808163 isoform X2 [Colossoma macropomum]